MSLDTMPPLVSSLVAALVIGYLTWQIASTIRNHIDLHKLRLEVTKALHNYVQKKDHDELLKEVRVLSVTMNKMAWKMGIDVQKE